MKNILLIIGASVILLGIGGCSANKQYTDSSKTSLVEMDSKDSSVESKAVQKEQSSAKQKESYVTIKPELKQDASQMTVLGKVLSHEVATIQARREGIIKDIMLDIGDQIYENQVVALLLPPGVEGENAAMIAEKQAMLKQASKQYENTKAVSDQTINKAKLEVNEARIALKNAVKTQNIETDLTQTVATKVTQEELKITDAALQEIQVARATLKVKEETLKKMVENRDKQLAEAEAEIRQMIEQSEVDIAHSRQITEQILLGQTGRVAVNYLTTNEIPSDFGALNTKKRSEVVDAYYAILTIEKQLPTISFEDKKKNMTDYINAAVDLMLKMEQLFQSTSTGFNVTLSQLGEYTEMVHDVKVDLLESKEKTQDSFLDYEIMYSTEAKNITEMENEIDEQKEMIKSTEENLNVAQATREKNTQTAEKEVERVQTMQENEVKMLRAKLNTAEKNLKAMQAEQKKMVDMAETELEVAQASLNAQVVTSSHQEIRSPFSGIVSKRFIEVGQVIEMSMPTFELVNVNTSLSRKAKQEIQFGIPEVIQSELLTGDTVIFFTLADETLPYQAVVTRKSPQVDQETYTITVQAKIDPANKFPPNTTVRVRIPTGEVPVYRIPSTAIMRENDQNKILVLKGDNDTEEILVNLLADDGEMSEITGNIDENTLILRNMPDMPIDEENNAIEK